MGKQNESIKHQQTISVAGVDFTNCEKGYCINCTLERKHKCQWEVDSFAHPEFHKQALDRYIDYLTKGETHN